MAAPHPLHARPAANVMIFARRHAARQSARTRGSEGPPGAGAEGAESAAHEQASRVLFGVGTSPRPVGVARAKRAGAGLGFERKRFLRKGKAKVSLRQEEQHV